MVQSLRLGNGVSRSRFSRFERTEQWADQVRVRPRCDLKSGTCCGTDRQDRGNRELLAQARPTPTISPDGAREGEQRACFERCFLPGRVDPSRSESFSARHRVAVGAATERSTRPLRRNSFNTNRYEIVAASVFWKWVARATRPAWPATRRPERRRRPRAALG